MSGGDPNRTQAALDRQIEIGAVDADKQIRRYLLLLRDEAASDAQQFGQPFQWLYETHHGQAVYGAQRLKARGLHLIAANASDIE